MAKYKLGDIVTLLNGRAYLMPELQDSGKYRILRVGNLSGGNDSWYYSDMELDENKYCENGDLLYAWACNFGPHIWREEKVIYHYHIWKLVENKEKVDRTYLYYYLLHQTPFYLGGVNGATMVHITKKNMEKKTVYIPSSLNVQHRIASILSTYDSLIENNTKRISLLEKMAENLYKEWFVRFRFPGHENVEMENGLPKGWKMTNLFDVADVTYGFAFKSNKFCDNAELNPVVRIRDIQENHTNTYTDEQCEDKYLIGKNAILIGMDGIFHMCLWNGERAYMNQRVVMLNSKEKGVCNYLLYLAIRPQIKYWEQVISGTTVAHLGDKHLRKVKVLLPEKAILEKANSIISRAMDEKNILQHQNSLLARQRDLLLPRLMSGKLEVKEELLE